MKYKNKLQDIDFLRAGNDDDFQKIYSKFKRRLISHLKSNYKNYVYYWEDLVLESITIVLEYDKTLELTCELMTFLFDIALNQLNNKIKKDKYLVFNDRLVKENVIVESIYVEIERDERKIIVNEALSKLKMRCQKILEAFCRTVNCREAAQSLGYKSEQVFNVKKSECMKELDKILMEAPRFVELRNNKND